MFFVFFVFEVKRRESEGVSIRNILEPSVKLSGESEFFIWGWRSICSFSCLVSRLRGESECADAGIGEKVNIKEGATYGW